MSAALIIAIALAALFNLGVATAAIRSELRAIRRERRDRRLIAELNRRRWVFAQQIEVTGGSGARR